MKFYVLEDPLDTKITQVTDYREVEPKYLGDAPTCSVCGGYIGLLPWLPPYRAELEVWGKEFGDIAFGTGMQLLLSERFVGLYRESGLKGLGGFDKVEITKVKRRGGSRIKPPSPKYYCAMVGLSRAAIDQKASEQILKEPWTCEECRSGILISIKRVVIEENTWSGEDIFIARGFPGTIITSEAFKKYFDENRINNGILIPAEEYHIEY